MQLLKYQAVVLAGGECKRLYPLTSGSVKALLPVGNKPLLSYPLKSLQDVGVKHAFIVVTGEDAALSISAWLNQVYHGQHHGSVHCEVIAVPEGTGTAEALRIVANKITLDTCLVFSGDLLTDVSVQAMVTKHQLTSALATVLIGQNKVSPSSETKLGKAPRNVDYIGLDESEERLVFYASSPEALRDLKVPMGVIRKFGTMSITTSCYDANLYVLSRAALNMLASKPQISSLAQEFLPYLTRQQLKKAAKPPQEKWEPGSTQHQVRIGLLQKSVYLITVSCRNSVAFACEASRQSPVTIH